MILVVSGTRNKLSAYNKAKVLRVVGLYMRVHPDSTIRVGDCPTGVDALIREKYRKANVYTAEWSVFGKAAGPVRNRFMLRGAYRLLAFPALEGSPGTLDAVHTATEMGINVQVVFLRTGREGVQPGVEPPDKEVGAGSEEGKDGSNDG